MNQIRVISNMKDPRKITIHHTRQALLWVYLFTSLAALLTPSIIQISEANQILSIADSALVTLPPPPPPPPIVSDPGSTDSGATATASAAAPGTATATAVALADAGRLPKLPKINIYVNKHEIRKLLGINERINYVTNGNLNMYPLGFTIPLGYNQSDIKFTWQNLDQTNVNYSISLTLSNDKAVETPSINITRLGRIPKQEQVFTITLPCSGLVTAEVDVQVLITITGLVTETDASAGQMDSAASQAGEPANMSTTESAAGVQSDQPAVAGSGGRLVSHQLAIKRKKICTQHPVVVKPHPGRSSNMQPPVLQPRPQPPQVNRWPSEAHSTNSPPSPKPNTDQQPSGHSPTLQAGGPHSVQPAGSSASSPPDTPGERSNEMSNRKSSELDPGAGFAMGAGRLDEDPSSADASPEAARRRVFAYRERWLMGHGALSVPPQDKLPPAPMLPPAPGPIPEDNPLNGFLNGNARQHQPTAVSHQQPPSIGGANNNPLVVSLIALSLVISVALVVIAFLGSSHRNPLEKLGTLTGCLLRRTPASQANKCKSPMASAVLSSLRAGPKSSASSMSGLSAISGHSKSYHSAAAAAGGAMGMGTGPYCYKTTNCSGYYTNANQYQQHHYQQPPTADLLGTGYQCTGPPPPQYPISHIATGNTSQMTRLIWNNGNGTSPDGFIVDGGSYLPHSNAPISDNGSAYQTIY